MDEKIKKGLKKFAQEAEIGFTRSVLRWKYKKEGVVPPREELLEDQSRQVAAQAREVIARRGKGVWKELKKAYSKGRTRGERPGK